MQELGLAEAYKSNDDIKSFCGMLDGLAFLPESQILDGMLFLRENVPQASHDEMLSLLEYFDATYVSGTFRRIQQPSTGDMSVPMRMRRIPPLYPPPIWNVHDATLNGLARTNNLCESWNYGFQQLVGHTNPSIWTCIDSIRKDQALVATSLLQHEQGIPMLKRIKRATVDLQSRLQNICIDFREGRRNVGEFLRAIGHCIRFK